MSEVVRRRPSRADLLRVIARLQHLVGVAQGVAMNDRDPNRSAKVAKALAQAHDLCIEARGYDDEVTSKSRNGWNFEEYDPTAY